MKTTFEPVGLLKRYCSDLLNAEGHIVLQQERLGTRLDFLCQDAGIPKNMISLFIVNGKVESSDYRIQTGDRVKCVALVGGG